MRKSLRWRIAKLVDRLDRQCWADLVSWAQGSAFYNRPWQPRSPACTQGALRQGRCYCGKLGRDGTIYDTGRVQGGGHR